MQLKTMVESAEPAEPKVMEEVAGQAVSIQEMAQSGWVLRPLMMLLDPFSSWPSPQGKETWTLVQ